MVDHPDFATSPDAIVRALTPDELALGLPCGPFDLAMLNAAIKLAFTKIAEVDAADNFVTSAAYAPATRALTLGLADGSNVVADLAGIDAATLGGHDPAWFAGIGALQALQNIVTGNAQANAQDHTAIYNAIASLQNAMAGIGIPAGLISAFAGNVAPVGWLKANGAAISRTAYANLFAVFGTLYGPGDGATTFNLPDYRGEFLRGWDDGRGVDPGRVFGSAQGGAMVEHNHFMFTNTSASSSTPEATGAQVVARRTDSSPGENEYIMRVGSGTPSAGITGSTGSVAGALGSEVRPRNVAPLICIKY
jgi:microcystin-dependent protein